jgi:aquaporin Z
MLRKFTAEAVGTFWLVFGGCGSAVLAAGYPELGIGFAGVSLAFGLLAVASGKAGWSPGGFASNGFADLSPGGYSITAALLVEVILTAGFLLVVLGSTSARAPQGFAPIAIGLALTLIHLVSIPVTNTSVNPARSTGVALFAETAALSQLWLFWLAPLAGAAIGAIIWRLMLAADEAG